MGTRYIEVNAGEFESFLKDHGFEPDLSGKEVVYYRQHEYNVNVLVLVYTSISTGKTSARDCGKDAIRVVTIFNDGNRSFGIGKFPRVYRTGSQEKIQERTLDRMRKAYSRGSNWIRENKCVCKKKST